MPPVYSIPLQIRWADIDANNHLLHSVYYDFGALIRMQFMNENGLTMQRLEELRCGPVIFREEALFKKEIHFQDNVRISMLMVKARNDFARWSLQHHIYRNENELCTIINLDGSFIDLDKRKVMIPPIEVQRVFDAIPKSEDFEFATYK
jgi:acyl-CoA thioester hydrolase